MSLTAPSSTSTSLMHIPATSVAAQQGVPPQSPVRKQAVSETKPLEKIVDSLKDIASDMDEGVPKQIIAEHMRDIGLMTDKGEWKGGLGGIFKLEEIEAQTQTKLQDYIQEVGGILIENPCLERCLGELDKEAHNKKLDNLLEKFKTPDGKKALQHAIMLSVTLDYLSDKIVHNRGYLEKVTKTLGMLKNMPLQTMKNIFKHGLAGGAKKSTVDYVINNILKSERDGGKLNPRLGQGLLSLNIFEMFIVDIPSNGQVGRDLSQFQYGQASGRGDTHREEGENIINMPVAGSSQKDNNDMYVSWNMNFVSTFDRWPFFIAKLANKAVAGYKDKPEHFMHPRGVALYLFIEWYKNAKKNNPVMCNTHMQDRMIREAMGRANIKNMEEFLEKSKDSPKSNFMARLGRFVDRCHRRGRITSVNAAV